MSVYLTSGAITKIVTGKCTQNDIKPELQVTFINRLITTKNGKKWYLVLLSDGSFEKFGLIPYEVFKSNDLWECYIVQLTKFQLYTIKDQGTRISVILCFGLVVTDRNWGYLGAPEPPPKNDTRLFDRITPTTIPDEDDVEEPPTSKQNTSASTKRHSSHSVTQNKKRQLQSSNDAISVFGKNFSETGINLTSGAMSKIMTGKCTETDLKPVLQVTFIDSGLKRFRNGEQFHLVALSDGSYIQSGFIPDEIFISNKLQEGSIVQLNKFHVIKGEAMVGTVEIGIKRHIHVSDLNLLCSKCDIIGIPELLFDNQIMGFDLTPGAITKIVTGKCTSNDLRPVLQVIYIYSDNLRAVPVEMVVFSDGSFMHSGYMPSEIFVSNELQIGSIVQLTKFRTIDLHNRKGEISAKSNILCYDLTVIHSECGIIGDPKVLLGETPLVEITTTTIPHEDHVKEPPTSKQKQDHVDSLLNEDIDDSHHVEDPSTSIKNPSTSTQKCSSHSPIQNKKRKLLTSDDKDISKLVSEIVEKTIEDGLGACFKKLGTVEEDVSKLTRMMMEKNNEDDVGVGSKKLETLEEDVSKLTRMMMEKNKEDDMGACIEKLDKLGWEAEDPLYDTALLLFGQSVDYRKLWLHLKPESCEKWVKNAGSMFGLLD